MFLLALLSIVLACALVGVIVWQLRKRHLERWLSTYLFETTRRAPRRRGETVHLLLCIADHFEPHNGKAPPKVAQARINRWLQSYPELFDGFRDCDGRPPQHTFFFPLEQYDPDHVEALATLCRRGFGELEVHLHHDRDSPEALRERLEDYKELVAWRHGLLARHRQTGELAYAFVHGNWALDNSRPDGSHCGVNNELDILRETGCYADFTFPSAPDVTQPRTINSIYYALDDPQRPKSHDFGIKAGSQPISPRALMLIQGPLLFDWQNRKWGILPRIENGCLQRSQPPSIERLPLWLKARVQVPLRPDWFFVKLHTHGAPEANQAVLLGEPMVRFHQELARYAEQDPHFHFHYVTAREMFNLVRAAESGWKGSVAEARDFELVWNSCSSSKVNATR